MKTHWLAVALSVGAFAAPARAAPLDRFFLPSVTGGDFRAVAAGPDGRVWVALRGAIGAADRDGVITRYATAGLSPDAIAAGPDGAVWFVASGTVARVAGGATTVVARGLSDGESIAAGPDGAMWVAETSAGRVARVAEDGSVRRFALGRGVHAWWLVAGPDGNLWFTGDKRAQGLVGRLTPAGDVATFRFPLALSERAPTIAAGADGNLWVASGLPDALVRVTPAGRISTVDVGDVPRALTVAPDGALWFTTYDALVRRSPGGVLTRFHDPYGVDTNCGDSTFLGPSPTLAVAADGTIWTPYADGALDRLAIGAAPPPVRPLLLARGSFRAPNAMARGNDGSAWIATNRAIVRVDTTGQHTVFHPWRGRRYVSLAPAAGGGMWFSSSDGLFRLTSAGRLRSYARRLPHRARLNELAPGPRGSVWYVDYHRRTVARMTSAGRVQEVRLGRRADPFGIAARPDGGVWVTDSHGAVERISNAGRVRRFARKGTADVPAITTAQDGSAWFTDFMARRVSHITAAGKIRRYRTHGHPTAIAIGPDGATWFTTTAGETSAAGLGRIDANGGEREFPVHLTCTASYLGLITGPDNNLWFTEDRSPVAVAELDPRRLLETGAL